MAAGQQLGLDEKKGRALTLQTALGAAQMAITADEITAVLRRKVTSSKYNRVPSPYLMR